MVDKVSKRKRSSIMAAVKASGNKSTEIAFIEILKKYSLKGWRRNYKLYGKPDFVFSKNRVAIFIDGCFWHSCPKHCRMPSSNTKYWQRKIVRNATRDREVSKELKKKGWTVIRFWEHDLKEGRGFSQKLSRLKKILTE